MKKEDFMKSPLRFERKWIEINNWNDFNGGALLKSPYEKSNDNISHTIERHCSDFTTGCMIKIYGGYLAKKHNAIFFEDDCIGLVDVLFEPFEAVLIAVFGIIYFVIKFIENLNKIKIIHMHTKI